MFQPAYKVQSQLLNATGAQNTVIQVTPGESHLSVTEFLLAHGARLHVVTTGEFGATVSATLDGGLIPELAQLPEVIWIQERIAGTLCNNNGQWVVQTGWRSTAPPDNSMAARRVWDQGVRGQRIVLGITDTGLNVFSPGHYMFRDASLVPVGPGIWPTHRKVVAYKLYGSATPTEVPYHGSHVSGTVAGDDSVSNGTSMRDGIARAASSTSSTSGTTIRPYCPIIPGPCGIRSIAGAACPIRSSRCSIPAPGGSRTRAAPINWRTP
jgi:hypothetical protein